MRRDEEFESLFVREFDRCVRVARRIVGGDDPARDMAAEAFARAWARWNTLRDQRPGAWVVRVTVNLAIDATRKRVVRVAPPGPSPSPEDPSTTRLLLTDALSQLPARQRAAIALRYFADCTEDDIAVALDVTKGTVKVHLHRGLGRLRGLLDPDTFREIRLDDPALPRTGDDR
ncbi:MAG TPA: sigma-70 family RNA polymerase sigma factor [Acidimicrobiia bacterium]|nr:sigma-70 family RNA polymerase sigma factor [Acidimicrobiia bacterium]